MTPMSGFGAIFFALALESNLVKVIQLKVKVTC